MDNTKLLQRMYAEQILQTQYLGEILQCLHEIGAKISEHEIPSKLLNNADVAIGVNKIRDSLARYVVDHLSDIPSAAKKA